MAELLAGLQLPVLLYELQLDQLPALHALLRVLLQDRSQELPELLGDLLAGWELDLVGDLASACLTILMRSSCSLMSKGDLPKYSS